MGFGKDGKGAIIREDVTITVGALTAKTGILQTAGGIHDNMQEDFRVLKTLINGQEFGVTSGEAFSDLYMSNGELTLAEIEEAIE